MTKENQLEAEKTKLMMLMALTNPDIKDQAKSREWSSVIKRIWKDLISLQFGLELDEREPEDEALMRNYYEQVVKHLKPKLKKTESGLAVEGLESLL